ncbi:hypothetical protein [Streptomyces sp. YPW6]|uniref:hypothetical protein n=1 Tax=Streptomyces sp. YPW6 TaxID=2840373 RepID=UPI003D729024
MDREADADVRPRAPEEARGLPGCPAHYLIDDNHAQQRAAAGKPSTRPRRSENNAKKNGVWASRWKGMLMDTAWRIKKRRGAREVLRRKSGPIVGGVLIAGLLAFGIEGMTTAVQARGWEEAPLGAGIMLPALRLIWRAVVRPKVEVYSDGFQVFGFFTRIWVPAGSVRSISTEPGLHMHTVHGDEIFVSAFSGSMLDRGRMAQAAARLQQALPKRRFRKNYAPHAVRAPDWAPMDVLLLFILAVVLNG